MIRELAEGTSAPGFAAPASTGERITLEGLRGDPVVLFFYPKDDTPGCTKEACGFRDAFEEIQELGAAVYGVSRDDLASHEKFVRKYELNFPLLSDTDGRITEAYGVWKEKNLYGKKSMGIERTTFLIDGDGVIRRIWRKVKVDGHAEEVIDSLNEL